jgi:flagellar hook assembly protein FlgD
MILITDHLQNEYEVPVILTVDINIGIENPKETISLDYNSPNPFTNETTIWFTLNEKSNTTLEIYNFSGQKIKDLLNGSELNKGSHSVRWDGSDNAGAKMEPGIYLCKLTSGKKVYTLKMILAR